MTTADLDALPTRHDGDPATLDPSHPFQIRRILIFFYAPTIYRLVLIYNIDMITLIRTHSPMTSRRHISPSASCWRRSGRQIHLNAKLPHFSFEQLLRRRYGRKSERIDPAQHLLFAQEILQQGRAGAGTGIRSEPGPAAASPPPGCGPRRRARTQAPAGEPAAHAGRARRPARRAPVPRLRPRRAPIRRGNPRTTEYVPASMIMIEHLRPKYACEGCEAPTS